MWVCPICQSKTKQRTCCSQILLYRGEEQVPFTINRDICEHSTYVTKSLTGHLQHMRKVHGWNVPIGKKKKKKKR